jgi:hypothetical protein
MISRIADPMTLTSLEAILPTFAAVVIPQTGEITQKFLMRVFACGSRWMYPLEGEAARLEDRAVSDTSGASPKLGIGEYAAM